MRHPSLLAIPFLVFVLLATAAAQQDASPAPGKYQDAATHGDTLAMTEIGRAYPPSWWRRRPAISPRLPEARTDRQ